MIGVLPLLLALACASTHSAGEAAAPAEVEEVPMTTSPADDLAAEAPEEAAPEEAAPEEAAPEEAAPEEAALEVFGAYRYAVIAPPEVSGSKLTIQVRHGGGCAEHRWSLVARGEAVDGVLPVNLVHDDGGDRCRALKIYPVTLDIGGQGLDLCGVHSLELAVAEDHQGAAAGSYSIAVPEAFSVCEGIVP